MRYLIHIEQLIQYMPKYIEIYRYIIVKIYSTIYSIHIAHYIQYSQDLHELYSKNIVPKTIVPVWD